MSMNLVVVDLPMILAYNNKYDYYGIVRIC